MQLCISTVFYLSNENYLLILYVLRIDFLIIYDKI